MKNLIIASFLTFLVAACAMTPNNPAFNDAGYKAWSESLVDKIKAKSDYRKIPIKSAEQKNNFIDLSYRAYKKEISKEEFIQKMEDDYPSYSDSIRWVAEQLPN